MTSEITWKRPSDVMSRRRKSVSQRRIVTEKRTNVIYKSPVKSVKRKNPFNKENFDSNPTKRAHIEPKHENGKGACDVNIQLFNLLDSIHEVGCVHITI